MTAAPVLVADRRRVMSGLLLVYDAPASVRTPYAELRMYRAHLAPSDLRVARFTDR